MITPIPHARRMNLIALALLITGLVSLIAFHLLVFVDHGPLGDLVYGWQVWPQVWGTLKSPNFGDIQGLIATSAFLTSLLLVAVSPFAILLFRVSRLGWWLATSLSGMALIGLSGVLLMSYSDEWERVGPGFHSLIASQVLNFLGLLFIRREVPAAPEVDPA